MQKYKSLLLCIHGGKSTNNPTMCSYTANINNRRFSRNDRTKDIYVTNSSSSFDRFEAKIFESFQCSVFALRYKVVMELGEDKRVSARGEVDVIYSKISNGKIGKR